MPGTAIITYLIIAVNIYIFYIELTTANIEKMILEYALIPANLSLADPASWLTLITSQFLHGGWFHLITNLLFLAVFGPNIEKAWGPARFLFYYLLAGVGAAFLQLVFTTQPQAAIIGASGAIAGVLGAYFVYFAHHRITTLVPLGIIPLFVGIPAGLILLYWFGLQLVGGFYTQSSDLGGVAFFAHVGGFLAGIILAVLTPRRNLGER